MVLNWTTASGKNFHYQILSATNLSNPVWAVFPGSVGAGSAGDWRPAIFHRPGHKFAAIISASSAVIEMDAVYEEIISEPIGGGSSEPNRFRPGVHFHRIARRLGVVAMLAAVLLSASFTTKDRVLQAECASNLRQIGTGWSMYQQDFNQMLPCHWPGLASSGSTSNPWRTYEAGRVVPGTVGWSSIGTDVQGPWNLGLLVATGMIPNPRILYCPGTALLGGQFSYNYYAAVSNTWPSTALPTGTRKSARDTIIFRKGKSRCTLMQAISGRYLSITHARFAPLCN